MTSELILVETIVLSLMNENVNGRTVILFASSVASYWYAEPNRDLWPRFLRTFTTRRIADGSNAETDANIQDFSMQS